MLENSQNTLANEAARIRHTGETIQMPGGLCEIIEWHNKFNIDVKFDDGTVVKNRKYSAFKRGQIGNPNVTPKRNHPTTTKKLKTDRIGETATDALGNKLEIIAYKNAHDIDILVNGSLLLKKKQYEAFANRDHVFIELRPKKDKKQSVPKPDFKKTRIGETSTASNGQKMTITAYRTNSDIDVIFEDGTEISHKTYRSFKNGNIGNPNRPTSALNTLKSDRVGETRLAKNGLSMTIIAYRTRKDMDIRFEDGVVVTGKEYEDFQKGEIAHPTVKTKRATLGAERIGQTALNNAGLQMEIVDYRSSSDIDIRFADGAVIKNRGYSAFLNGTIKHPLLRTGEYFHGFHILSKAYKMPNEIFYYCVRPNGIRDVLSPAQILAECK